MNCTGLCSREEVFCMIFSVGVTGTLITSMAGTIQQLRRNTSEAQSTRQELQRSARAPGLLVQYFVKKHFLVLVLRSARSWVY